MGAEPFAISRPARSQRMALVLCVEESSPITNRSALNGMGGSLLLPVGVITASADQHAGSFVGGPKHFNGQNYVRTNLVCCRCKAAIGIGGFAALEPRENFLECRRYCPSAAAIGLVIARVPSGGRQPIAQAPLYSDASAASRAAGPTDSMAAGRCRPILVFQTVRKR
jgi:hypothetical protein